MSHEATPAKDILDLQELQELRQWKKRVLSAAEDLFGESSVRYKLSLNTRGRPTNVFPKGLDGAWVALQRAEDDGHIGLVATIEDLRAQLAAAQAQQATRREPSAAVS